MGIVLPAIATSLGASAATAATLGTIGTVASTGMSVLGAIQNYQGAKYQAKASSKANAYQAAVASNNAITARNNAALSAQEGAAQTEAAQLENRARVGAIKTNQGASGVDLNSESATDVRSSAAQTGQLSAINIRSAATRKVYGYNQEAKDAEAQAGLYNAEAKNDITAGNMNGTTTLLGGLADANDSYNTYKYNKSMAPA